MDNYGKIPDRSEISDEYKWRLEDMFASDSDWERECESLREYIGIFAGFQGRLSESASILLKCLEAQDDAASRCEMVYAYARMRRDEDNNNDKYQAYAGAAMTLYSEVMTATSYIAPEILAMSEETLRLFIEGDALDKTEGVIGGDESFKTKSAIGKDVPLITKGVIGGDESFKTKSAIGDDEFGKPGGLGIYSHFFNDLLRQKAHILSNREEEILAMASETLNSSSDIYTKFSNADLKFPNVTDDTGKEVELSEGRYVRLLESFDRQVRENTFKTLYATYGSFKNTIAASLSACIQKDRFVSAVRHYSSTIEAHLDADNVPVSVYDNLIETVNRNLSLLHRYIRLRRKALNIEKLHMYDLYVPMVAPTERRIPYDTALNLVVEGLSGLGEKYVEDVKRAVRSGWTDIYENLGKTRGAYSWGAYKSHPYVLMNYQGAIDDVMTLAHELGHAMHSYYTNLVQPYVYSGYKIFVAEVASTVNEALLINYLINDSDYARDAKEKAYLINRQLETFRGTLFRQTMFAEFERIIHKKSDNGESFSPELFSTIYKELNDKYFSSEVEVDSQIALEWARIPHFYNAFYVYQYATGISAATSLAKRISSEGSCGPSVDRYMKFLSSGGSDYPLELLKLAGVDMTVPAPVEEALQVFESSLYKLEELI